MEHKAFAFDYNSFDNELCPLLERALESGDPAAIAAFIDENRTRCTDPYEGEALNEKWRDALSAGDVHEYGDLALTAYYDVTQPEGIGYLWSEISDNLPEKAKVSLLGSPVGSAVCFDPGRMGSYFQTPEDVRYSLAILAKLHLSELSGYLMLLQRCASENLGVYVTF